MDKLNFKGTVSFLKRNCKVLVIVFFASAAVAAGLSLLLPNYYKSQVLMIPSAVNSISKSLLNEGDRLDPYMYGTEKESEYILEILSSWQIIQNTADKFNLKEHYGIKDDSPLSNQRMVMKLASNIKVKRTDYIGVKLTVWDTDPKYAKEMAEYMISQMETLRTQMKQAKADSIRHSLEVSRQRMVDGLTLLADSLAGMAQKYGIYEPESYSERFSQELAKQVAAGNTAAVSRLEAKMENLRTYGPQIQNLREQLENKRKSLQTWDEHYEQAILDLNAKIPTDFIVEHATMSYKKDKPKRSIIVIIAALCCTLIAAEVLVLREKKSSSTEDNA